MNRSLALTAAAAALMLSLSGCGAKRMDGGMPDSGSIAGGITATDTMRNDDGQTGTGTSSGATSETDAAGNGLGSVAGSLRGKRDPMRNSYAIGGPNSSVYSAAYNRGVTQEQAAARSRFRRMMENGRVHDTDGFLLDGENATNSTF